MRNPDLLVRARAVLCAVPLSCVEETMRPLPVEPLTGAPPCVRGLSVIRGQPVPVVDLGALLRGDAAAQTTRFVTLRAAERRVALAVEAVLGVREPAPGLQTEMPPLLSQANPDAVEAVAALDSRLIVILRAARLLPEEAWNRLAAAGRASATAGEATP